MESLLYTALLATTVAVSGYAGYVAVNRFMETKASPSTPLSTNKLTVASPARAPATSNVIAASASNQVNYNSVQNAYSNVISNTPTMSNTSNVSSKFEDFGGYEFMDLVKGTQTYGFTDDKESCKVIAGKPYCA
jgi:hypothetical protein